MVFHAAIEDMEPGNWVTWVFEYPGCYARGSTRDQALGLVPQAIEEHIVRLRQARFLPDDESPEISVVVAEEFRAFQSTPDYLVNAFFNNDRIPLSENDIKYARCILAMNRDDLLAVVAGLTQDDLDREIRGEVQKNIGGILRHIGTAEWWYWDRLGLAFPRQERPVDHMTLLAVIREFTIKHLPELVGSTLIRSCSGEEWSPRKLLRRTIWHERVHTLQIKRYIEGGRIDKRGN